MENHMRKLLLAAVVAATVTGCASLGRKAFAEPKVTLQEMRLNGLGLTGGSLDVLLNVENPNGFRLDATRMTYRLMIDTIPFGEGTVDQRLTVDEKSQTTVRIPVNFTYSGIGAAGRAILNTGTVNYRLLGDLTVATPLGNFTRPYDMAGRYSLMSGHSR
jgi:LEA14-like dessication related protein